MVLLITRQKVFAKADLVMIAQDANNQPGYIAVEVSFTISDNDVRRAVRNAEYLHKYTGIRSHAAVAGVDILSDAKQQVDSGKVHWYEIPIREYTAGVDDEVDDDGDWRSRATR